MKTLVLSIEPSTEEREALLSLWEEGREQTPIAYQLSYGMFQGVLAEYVEGMRDDTYDHPGRKNDREAVIRYAYAKAFEDRAAGVSYKRFRDDWLEQDSTLKRLSCEGEQTGK